MKSQIEQFWNLGVESRMKMLQAVYGNTMDYWSENTYDELPYGIKKRLETLISALEAKQNEKS